MISQIKNRLISLLLMALLIGGFLFLSGNPTIAGVPSSIIFKFLGDSKAVAAFFSQDRQMLHDQLQKIGIEEDIKNYYRPKIADEIELDRYIHQLFYNLTGYIGLNYDLNEQKELVLNESGKRRLQDEIKNRILNEKEFIS